MKKILRHISAALPLALVLGCGESKVDAENNSPIATEPGDEPIDYSSKPGNMLSCELFASADDGPGTRCSLQENLKEALGLTEVDVVNRPSLLQFRYSFICNISSGLNLSNIILKTDVQQRRLLFNVEDNVLSIFGRNSSTVDVVMVNELGEEDSLIGPATGCFLSLEHVGTESF